jgi:hypothetical protein
MTIQSRIVKFIPKITHAKTEYREITPEDMTWVQEQLLRWTLQIAELDMSRDRNIKQIRVQFHERNQDLPKGKEGANSVSSFVAGTLSNLMFNGQRDLSDKQMNALETISNIMAIYFPNNTAIKFQIGFEQ